MSSSTAIGAEGTDGQPNKKIFTWENKFIMISKVLYALILQL